MTCDVERDAAEHLAPGAPDQLDHVADLVQQFDAGVVIKRGEDTPDLATGRETPETIGGASEATMNTRTTPPGHLT